jgi:hypothetical protein
MAAQKVVDGQETVSGPASLPESKPAGGDPQVMPLYVHALANQSTATQNVEVGQETDVGPSVSEAIRTMVPQFVPLKAIAPSGYTVATHILSETHETAMRLPSNKPTEEGVLQTFPL